MKSILTFCLILLLSFNEKGANADEHYELHYKINSLEKSNTDIENLFLNNMVYNIIANDKVCYLQSTSILEQEGIYSKAEGNEHIYINYLNKNVFFDLLSNNNYTYEKTKFIKEDAYKGKLNGFNVNKFVSEDGNCIIYSSTELPWYIQPCIFDELNMNESVIKFVNLKSKYEIELIDYKKVSDKSVNDIQKILNRKSVNKKTSIICPFFE